MLDFDTHQHHSWLVISVAGDIDLSNADQVKTNIESAIDSGAEKIAVDLRKVGFMDSTGLRVLIESHEQLANQDRELLIVATKGPIERLFEITALHRYLSIVSDLPEAD